MIVPLPLKPLKTRGQFFFYNIGTHHTGTLYLTIQGAPTSTQAQAPALHPPSLLRTWKAFLLVKTSFPNFFCPYKIKFALTVQPVQNSFIMPKLKLLIKMKVNGKRNRTAMLVVKRSAGFGNLRIQ